MTNKYQETLDWVLRNLTDIHENGVNSLSFVAIEHLVTLQELIDDYKAIKNELCLHCGKYKNAHLSACRDCRWNNDKRRITKRIKPNKKSLTDLC